MVFSGCNGVPTEAQAKTEANPAAETARVPVLGVWSKTSNGHVTEDPKPTKPTTQPKKPVSVLLIVM